MIGIRQYFTRIFPEQILPCSNEFNLCSAELGKFIKLTYNASKKLESILLLTYVLNEFLTANRSCTTKYRV